MDRSTGQSAWTVASSTTEATASWRMKMTLKPYTHTTVTQDGWSVSCTTGSRINGAILSLRRFRIAGRDMGCNGTRGYGDGRLFASRQAAWQWAFDHGYIRLHFTDPETRARRKATRSWDWMTRKLRVA